MRACLTAFGFAAALVCSLSYIGVGLCLFAIVGVGDWLAGRLLGDDS